MNNSKKKKFKYRQFLKPVGDYDWDRLIAEINLEFSKINI